MRSLSEMPRTPMQDLPSPARELAIPSSLGRLDHAISMLGERLNSLYQRLGPVMTELPANPSGHGEKPSPPVGISGQIIRLSDRLEHQAQQIEVIISQLEI